MIIVKKGEQVLYTLEDHMLQRWTEETVTVPLVDMATIVGLAVFMRNERSLVKAQIKLVGEEGGEPRVYVGERVPDPST